ncbi:MAG: glycoside hydrolase family 92 protein, partial [Sphingobacteriales bacterium]
YVYFVIKFSKPILNSGSWQDDKATAGLQAATGKNLKAWFQFDLSTSKDLYVKVAISAVSIEGAKKNLAAENPGWDFETVKMNAGKKWNTELSKIEVEGDEERKKIFYTALYHTAVVPNINMDVDAQYRGRDLKIHTAEGFTNYSVFSLWDTYRGANPLYTIIDQRRTLDYIKTFLLQYQQGGRLPVWELASCETDCMIGYHSIPVIVDAYMKGIRGFDTDLALEAMKKSATWNHLGLPAYIQNGVISMDDEHESVSKTLEYAYDDWCIAIFAKALGKQADYETYIHRAQYYKNILDTKTGFMRPRQNGGWISPFDPREVNNSFTEANSWQYSFYFPQDINGYMQLMGGKVNLGKKLDSLFAAPQLTTGRDQSDITGLIGQYAHGNEPSHHIIYLYNYADKPY